MSLADGTAWEKEFGTYEENVMKYVGRRMEMKMKLLKMRNIDCFNMSSAEFLQFALHCEQTKQDVGPHDPAYVHFTQQQMDYEQAMVIAEKLEIIKDNMLRGIPNKLMDL